MISIVFNQQVTLIKQVTLTNKILKLYLTKNSFKHSFTSSLLLIMVKETESNPNESCSVYSYTTNNINTHKKNNFKQFRKTVIVVNDTKSEQWTHLYI